MESTNLKRVITALATPFVNGKVDFDSIKSLLKYQLNNGVTGFVINGTTAESPTLIAEEREAIFMLAKEYAPKGTLLIMGTGSNSTADSILQTQRAAALGADAALVVVPYYNKPPQRGLIQHFSKIAECSELNIILYNVPGRTITALEPESVITLAKHKKIIGIKEASGSMETLAKIKAGVPADFVLLSGDDESYVEFLSNGGQGVISVASHVIPKEMVSWQNSNDGWQVARQEIAKKQKLIQNLFSEANPIPLKMALFKMGIIASPEMRLPLVGLSPEKSNELVKELINQGMMNDKG